MNPEALADARASDARRAVARRSGRSTASPTPRRTVTSPAGSPRRPGRPAFEHLVAQRDAFTIERLREGGAVLIGLTNMPPMANGGMQRGVYGRAESPYNADYLTAAFGSGSSNGSGTATAALVRGVRARRGDLVVGPRARVEQRAVRVHPLEGCHLGARQLAARAHHGRGRAAHPHHGRPARGARRDRRRRPRDARRLLARAAVGADPARRPRCGPPSYRALRPADAASARAALAGRRFGVPRMYVNADPDAGTAEPGRSPASAEPPGSASRPGHP